MPTVETWIVDRLGTAYDRLCTGYDLAALVQNEDLLVRFYGRVQRRLYCVAGLKYLCVFPLSIDRLCGMAACDYGRTVKYQADRHRRFYVDGFADSALLYKV